MTGSPAPRRLTPTAGSRRGRRPRDDRRDRRWARAPGQPSRVLRAGRVRRLPLRARRLPPPRQPAPATPATGPPSRSATCRRSRRSMRSRTTPPASPPTPRSPSPAAPGNLPARSHSGSRLRPKRSSPSRRPRTAGRPRYATDPVDGRTNVPRHAALAGRCARRILGVPCPRPGPGDRHHPGRRVDRRPRPDGDRGGLRPGRRRADGRQFHDLAGRRGPLRAAWPDAGVRARRAGARDPLHGDHPGAASAGPGRTSSSRRTSSSGSRPRAPVAAPGPLAAVRA